MNSLKTMISDKLKIEMRLRDAQYDSLLQLEGVLQTRGVASKKVYTQADLTNIYRLVMRRQGTFDYSFPSFCFALATGVGKTRLLGACIYTLYKEKGYKNFFVIAPSRTIYEKFIREFEEKSPKYIFEGITDLPKFRVLTGEDFNKANVKQSTLWHEDFTVYIFNIDKFKSEERILEVKKINEYLGQSFYDYVSNLPDLVVLMDESHKYKTPIAIKAINGLKPLLGLEFTATPFKKITEGGKTGKFENILYEYPLGAALDAERPVLKRPQLLYRKNFDYDSLSKKDLYDLLISDALNRQERIKTILQTYFENEDIDPQARFLPLVLIVCEDIRHAINTEKYLKKQYAGGKYKEKIVRIHSTPRGNKDLPKEEQYDEDTEVEKLLELEKSTNFYEIVINVNKLGLGWDVKNVYTIVPLRAFDSQVFVEQTIGRGLRLPFGKWVQEEELNTLRVAYHSNFGKVIKVAEAWLKNIEVVEPPKRQLEPYVLKLQNKDKAIEIPHVESNVDIDFTLAYFDPEVAPQLENVEVSLVVKDLATREETEIGKIKEKLKESPKEYILAKLLELPDLSTQELPTLDKIVNKYLHLLGKTRKQINLENRARIINDIYEQIKVKIATKTTITYAPTEEKMQYSDYETHLEKGFAKRDFEQWDDKETKRGVVTGYKKSIYPENVFDTRQERIVAKILEKDKQVIRWFRPYKKTNFSIICQHRGDRLSYIPDFIAETKQRFHIIEPKSKDEVEKAKISQDEASKTEVRKKAEATLDWMKQVNKISRKKWEYWLIPHHRITSSVNSLKKLLNQAVQITRQ